MRALGRTLLFGQWFHKLKRLSNANLTGHFLLLSPSRPHLWIWQQLLSPTNKLLPPPSTRGYLCYGLRRRPRWLIASRSWTNRHNLECHVIFPSLCVFSWPFKRASMYDIRRERGRELRTAANCGQTVQLLQTKRGEGSENSKNLWTSNIEAPLSEIDWSIHWSLAAEDGAFSVNAQRS